MELTQLRYLRATVRAGSMTAAAEAEHISQPSVSKQLRALERELGVPLFHRVGRRVVPTDAARELADCADRVFDDMASTVAAAAGAAQGGGGALRICATETVTGHILPHALTALLREWPQARVRVEMLGTDDSVARVLADEVDFAIVALPLADSRLAVETLFEEDVLCALPSGHQWTARQRIPLRMALEARGLLLSMPGHGLRTIVDEQARRLGVDLRPRIELRSQQALLAMVAAGGGIALAPRIAVAARSDIAALPFSPGLKRTVGWVRRRGRHVPPVGQRLIEIVGELQR